MKKLAVSLLALAPALALAAPAAWTVDASHSQVGFSVKHLVISQVRGEFSSIATRTPGLRITEHLPLLAALSERFSLIRSMTPGEREPYWARLFLTQTMSLMVVGTPSSGPMG